MTSRSKVTLTFAGEDKQLRKTFDNVEKRADRLQDRFKRFSKMAGAAGLAIGGMAVAGGTALFKLGESFDKAYDKIITGTGATGKALEGLQDSFKNVLATGPDSMDQVATAIADLNTATGQVGKPLEDLSRQILDLSRLTGEDLGGVIKSTTRLFGDWGVAVEDQALTLDKLFVASQETGIGVQELADTVVKSGAPFRQLGFTLDEQIALISKWRKEGVNLEIVLSGLRQAISKMGREGVDLEQGLRSTTAAILDAGSASEATTIAIEAFGAEAGPDMAALIREGRLEVEDLVAKLGDAEGQIGKTADATASFGEKWAEFKNKLAVALEPAATKVFDAIGDWLDDVGPKLERDVIPAFEDFWDSFTKKGGEVKRFIENELVPTLKGMFDDLTDGFDDTQPEAEQFFQDLKSLYDRFFGQTERDTAGHTQRQESTWNRHFGNMIEGHNRQQQTVFKIYNTIRDFLARWGEGLRDDWRRVSDFFSRWGEGIKRDFWRIVEFLRSSWSNAMGNLRIAWQTFTGMFSGTAGRISSALSGVAAAISEPFRLGYLKAVQWANKIPGISIKGPTVRLSGVASNLRVPTSRSSGSFTSSRSSGSFTSSSRTFRPRNVRHSGGPVRGQRIGQEVPILAKSGEHVVTANQMSAMRSGGSGPIVIKIDSGGSRMDDLIVQVLRKSIANRGGSVQAVLG